MTAPDHHDAPEVDRVARIQREWHRVRPDLDVSPLGVVGRLHRVAAALTAELVRLYARHGLTEGDFDVLAALRRGGDEGRRGAGELAAATMVTTGGMTKRLDRLQSAGLVERTVSADDGRGRTVSLTSRGREVIDVAFAEHVDNERRLLAGFSTEERVVLESLLTAWLARLDSGSGSAPGD